MKQTTNETRDINERITESGISRRGALQTTEKYAALTSVTLMLVLTPKAQAQVSEPGDPTEWWLP